MRRTLLMLMTVLLMLTVTGCGDNHHSRFFVREILSDDTVDGTISVNPATPGVFTVAQVVRDRLPSVFAGVDPSTGVESRAMLDFPLTSVPLGAIIDSATLDIVIDSIAPTNGSIPIRIELVSFAPPLLGTEFDRVLFPPLATATITPPISFADVNHHVPVDVTSLMTIAQARGFSDFQIRLLEDLGFVAPGLVEIDDTVPATAPLLRVTFF